MFLNSREGIEVQSAGLIVKFSPTVVSSTIDSHVVRTGVFQQVPPPWLYCDTIHLFVLFTVSAG